VLAVCAASLGATCAVACASHAACYCCDVLLNGNGTQSWLACGQGPVVYGAKIEDRFKPTDKVKVVLASATLMNKTDGRGSAKEQAWNHTAETRIKAGEDDKLLVSFSPVSLQLLCMHTAARPPPCHASHAYPISACHCFLLALHTVKFTAGEMCCADFQSAKLTSFIL